MWPTVIITSIIALTVIAIIVNEIRKRKKGKCSCDCSCCAMRGSCHSNDQ